MGKQSQPQLQLTEVELGLQVGEEFDNIQYRFLLSNYFWQSFPKMDILNIAKLSAALGWHKRYFHSDGPPTQPFHFISFISANYKPPNHPQEK